MQDDIDTQRPPYLGALATFVVIFAIYFVTLSPTTAFWDTSEYIAAAYTLGIPHPPGNPLFTLMAHVWGMIPLAADYAQRINLFAAFTSAAGAALWFLIAERWTRSILPARGPRMAAAFAGVLASATAWTVWNQSTVNEKVYTVSLLSIALVVWFTLRWADEAPGERRDRWLIASVYVLALSSTNHMMGVLAAPVLGIYVLMTDWRVILRPKVIASVVIVAIVGLSLNYIYLPIRAGQYPPINEGEPIGFFSKALSDVLGRVQYQKPPVSQRMSPLSAQLAMYWEYWSWQWARDFSSVSALITGFFTALGLGGLIALFRRNLRAGLSAAALLGTLTLMLIYYLNFKYSPSYHTSDVSIIQDAREVRERDYFFIASFAFVGVLFAAGFAAAIKAVHDWLGEKGTNTTRWLASSPILALGLIPLLGNHTSASRAHETLARDFAIDILESVEPYGILITAGDNDTFPLWFAQEVLGVRRDVTLANLSLMNTDWHLRQIKRREIPAFDPATAAKIWRPNTDRDSLNLGGVPKGGWVQPKAPVFTMSLDSLSTLPEVSAAPKGSIAFDSVIVTFSQQYITRSDLAALFLIRDNIGKRPIYFSWSDGNYPSTLGLDPYLVSHGMVRKLMPNVVKEGGAIHSGEYLGMVDVERTRALLFGTYHPDAAARSRPFGWVDPPSASILQLYGIAYGGFAPVLRAMGDSASALKAELITRGVVNAINGRN
ncbi:MAG: DUF2723 domain-containing protein [Gemmatimonadota bacterium]